MLSFGLLLGGIGVAFIAPEKYIFMTDHSIALIVIGLVIIGISQSLCVLPSIPQFIELILKVYPGELMAAGDMASSLFIGSYAGGTFLGPVLGGYLYQY